MDKMKGMNLKFITTIFRKTLGYYSSSCYVQLKIEYLILITNKIEAMLKHENKHCLSALDVYV